VRAAETEPIDPEGVAAALDSDPTIDAVAVVHHETTTGLLNPVHEIATMAGARDVRVAVDAISSLGRRTCGLPGLASTWWRAPPTSASTACPEPPSCSCPLPAPSGAYEAPRRSLYLDIPGYLEAQRRSSVPFTPAVPAVYGLEAALDELLDEGPGHRRSEYPEALRGAIAIGPSSTRNTATSSGYAPLR